MKDILAALLDCVASPWIHIAGKLLEISLAGAFGGLINGVSMLFVEGRKERDGRITWDASRGIPVRMYLLGQAGIGTGGAFAAVFGMLTIGNAVRAGATNDITDIPMYLVSLCVVGGFVGNRLLTRIGDKLIEDLIAKTNRANNKADEANAKVDKLIDQADKMFLDIASGLAVFEELEACIRDNTPSGEDLRERAKEIFEKLSEYAKNLPTARPVAIIRANISFDLAYTGTSLDQRLVDRAFKILDEFLHAREKAGKPEDDDVATIWFNIACYSAVLSLKTSGNEADKWLVKSRDAVHTTLKIAKKRNAHSLASWLTKLERDSDLAQLRERTDLYQPLLKSFKT